MANSAKSAKERMIEEALHAVKFGGPYREEARQFLRENGEMILY